MENIEQRSEIPPQGTVMAGIGLGMINGLVISIPVSAELKDTEVATHEAVTEDRALPVLETIDPAVLPWTMVIGMVIGGVLGVVKARIEQRGQSFFTSQNNNT